MKGVTRAEETGRAAISEDKMRSFVLSACTCTTHNSLCVYVCVCVCVCVCVYVCVFVCLAHAQHQTLHTYSNAFFIQCVPVAIKVKDGLRFQVAAEP